MGSFSEALNLSAKVSNNINPHFQTNIRYISKGSHLLVKMGLIQREHLFLKKGHSVRAFNFFKWGH